jgi:hypothetical protein
VTLDRPSDQLNRTYNESDNPSAFHPEHQSIVLHLLWEALDYVERANPQADSSHLARDRST